MRQSLFFYLALPAAGLANPIATVAAPTCQNGTITLNNRACTFKCGIDYPGGDYSSLRVTSFQDCANTCANNAKCIGAQFSHNDNFCYLKDVVTYASAVGGVDSVICDPLPGSATSSTPACPVPTSFPNGRTCQVACGKDRYGGDISSAWCNTLEDCMTTCQGQPACVTAQFYNNFCYLKVSNLNSIHDNLAKRSDRMSQTHLSITQWSTPLTAPPAHLPLFPSPLPAYLPASWPFLPNQRPLPPSKASFTQLN